MSVSANSTVRRSSRKRNLRMNMKIMNKLYHLSDGARHVSVHPPASMRPGLNMDSKNPKDELGRYLRVFSVEDSNGIPEFKRKRTIVLKHLPGEHAYYDDANGKRWSLEPIEGVTAIKKRGKARQGFQSATRISANPSAKRRPGRPKGSKNKALETATA